MDVRAYNRRAWDRNVVDGEPWTIPVDAETIARARQGSWEIYLTPGRPVPSSWFPPLKGKAVLCLASGGGQQGPILAAVGAEVTVLDNSPLQLAQDEWVARRDGLKLTLTLGDMTDLSALSSESFDLIVLPIANLFIEDLEPLWSETYRVLRNGGVLMVGFMNPLFYIFDREGMDDRKVLSVRFSLPYSDLTSLQPDELRRIKEFGWPLEFGHTLETQIGGQLRAGFNLTGLYEDRDERSVLSQFSSVYIATRMIKP